MDLLRTESVSHRLFTAKSRVRYWVNLFKIYDGKTDTEADASGRTVSGVDLRPLACWNCGFESRRGHRILSVAIVVCCQVEVRRSPISECVCVIKGEQVQQ